MIEKFLVHMTKNLVMKPVRFFVGKCPKYQKNISVTEAFDSHLDHLLLRVRKQFIILNTFLGKNETSWKSSKGLNVSMPLK